MTKHFLTICLIIGSVCLNAQVFKSNADTMPSAVKFELKVGHVGWGNLNDKIIGNINSESRFFIQNFHNKTFSIGLLELNAIFYNRIGICTSLLDWETGTINSSDVYKNIQKYIPEFEVKIPEQTEDTDTSSYRSYVEGSFNSLSFKLGFSGIFKMNKIQVSPFIHALVIPAKNKYQIDKMELIDKQTNEKFVRDYFLEEKADFGYRFGVDIRYNFKYLFIGARTNITQFKTDGIERISNYTIIGDEISTTTTNYSRNFSTYSINLFLGVNQSVFRQSK